VPAARGLTQGRGGDAVAVVHGAAANDTAVSAPGGGHLAEDHRAPWPQHQARLVRVAIALRQNVRQVPTWPADRIRDGDGDALWCSRLRPLWISRDRAPAPDSNPRPRAQYGRQAPEIQDI